MHPWSFDHDWCWTWWTFGVRYSHEAYGDRQIILGLGPLMLIWTRFFGVDP